MTLGSPFAPAAAVQAGEELENVMDSARARDAPAPEPEAVYDAHALLDRGDYRAAVEVLVREHGDAVFAFCLRMLRNRSLAEDVAQQVFLHAFHDIGQFQRRSPLLGWLFGIAGHRCLDAINSERRRLRCIESNDQTTLDVPARGVSPNDRLEQSRLIDALDQCLDVVSAEIRMTILLRFRSGMSYPEMSAVLGVRSETLQTRVARALPVLRRCLESKGWHDD